MKIETNFHLYPELNLDEQQLKNSIRKHFGAIRAPIYLYIDPKLQTCHGLHACRNITHYKRLPEVSLKKEARKNKNHFHKISLSYKHLSEAKSSAVKKTTELRDWTFPEWPRTHRFYHSILLPYCHMSYNTLDKRSMEYNTRDITGWSMTRRFSIRQTLNMMRVWQSLRKPLNF